jgi:hypothetical protein
MMVVLLAQLAAAQSALETARDALEPFNADPFRPAMGPGALLATESAHVPDQFIARADLIQVHNPLIWISKDGEQFEFIGDAIGIHLGAGRGLGRTQLGISAPLIRLLTSDTEAVPSVLAGDLALSAKYAVLQKDWLALAGIGALTFPLGADTFHLGHDGISGDLGVAMGGGEGLAWLTNIAYRIQPSVSLSNVAEVLVLKNAVVVRGGVSLPVGEQLALSGELLTSFIPTDLMAESTPMEVMVGASHQTREGRLLRGGLGVGIVGAVGAPTWRLMIGIGHDPGAPLILVPEETPLPQQPLPAEAEPRTAPNTTPPVTP